MSSPQRRATSLTLDRTLLDEAKALGVNLSRAAEAGLQSAVRTERRRRWAEENAGFIKAYTEMIEEEGIPLSDIRVTGW